jgi:hemerythrin-like domain-containing protein
MPLRIGQRPDHDFDKPLGLLSDCHRRIEYFLQVLIVITRQAAGGPLSALDRAQLDGAIRYFETAAPKHTADEEESLFPRLRALNAAVATEALDVVARLERDHDRVNDHHRHVDDLVRRWLTNGTLPSADVTELGERLRALEAMYQEHIAVEDGKLFPIAGRLLSTDQLRDVGREMAARRRVSTSKSS